MEANLPENESSGVRMPVRRSVRPENLHICPSCDSPLVYPVEWAAVDMTHWRVELRCPECEWRRVDLFDQETVDRYDDVLCEATDALAARLEEIEREQMASDVERFVAALAADAITPFDF